VLPLPLLPSRQHGHDIWIYIILDDVVVYTIDMSNDSHGTEER
jgi:hypothetical protein